MSDIELLLSKNNIVLLYLSHDECNVCVALKPKIQEMLKLNFPEIKFHYVNVKESPAVSSQLGVFEVPTILLFIDKKEYIRIGRNISIKILKEKIVRLLYLLDL